MDAFVISGGKKLQGHVTLGGAKNVAIKVCLASLLTDEELILRNVPQISDVSVVLELLKHLGVSVSWRGEALHVQNGRIKKYHVPLEIGARLRTSSMVLGPLLTRYGQAVIPNPGGCRIGARPIDRHIEGLRQMGASIDYRSSDGYFYAKTDGLHGISYTFAKNTHTGTETLILAAVLAKGRTILKNAAEEVEVDDLIACLVQMGANIKRSGIREITIEGVFRLGGTEYSIMPDRNEEVTFAIAAAITNGVITVQKSQRNVLGVFLDTFQKAGGVYEKVDDRTTTYARSKKLHATDIATGAFPGFMTDWQAPWAVFMTQVPGVSTIHETVFESRFSYVQELKKMGAAIEYFDPKVTNPEEFYNFNFKDRIQGYHQAVRIKGPTKLHNAILVMDDLRAGATLVLAALAASGESYIHGIEQIDRGYEKIEERLQELGARIKRISE
ncbi:UDP-N-acetylglucosamine 1-carboxyvinyltransferase [Candidatus Gottesmanbacteria bacterium]|nr:UDP-N-acetylglucosamine 1-carboxyvinyltransferase [Candidatus Gottesmanbacteria bacterium]